jgi:hypothetical protein
LTVVARLDLVKLGDDSNEVEESPATLTEIFDQQPRDFRNGVST